MLGRPRTGGGKISLPTTTDVVTQLPVNAQILWISCDQDIWITINGSATSLGVMDATKGTMMRAFQDPLGALVAQGIDGYVHAAAVSTAGNVWITVF